MHVGKITWVVSFTKQLKETEKVTDDIFIRHHLICWEKNLVKMEWRWPVAEKGREQNGDVRYKLRVCANIQGWESHSWLLPRTWPYRNVFSFWISIWMQYLSSHPWPCLILLLCSASQMHSDPERWKQKCTHARTREKKNRSEGSPQICQTFFLCFCSHSPAGQHEWSRALKEAKVSPLYQVNQHFLQKNKNKSQLSLDYHTWGHVLPQVCSLLQTANTEN